MFRRKWQIEWYSNGGFQEPGQACFTRWGANHLAYWFNRHAAYQGYSIRARVIPR